MAVILGIDPGSLKTGYVRVLLKPLACKSN